MAPCNWLMQSQFVRHALSFVPRVLMMTNGATRLAIPDHTPLHFASDQSVIGVVQILQLDLATDQLAEFVPAVHEHVHDHRQVHALARAAETGASQNPLPSNIDGSIDSRMPSG